jgi:excisionase family DNA binding protein
MKRSSNLGVRQAALKLQCSLKNVYDLLYAGRLPGAIKIGRTWKIPARTIENRLKARSRP